MIFIWFSDELDGPNVTDQLLQNTHVYYNLRQSSGMAFYTTWEYQHLRNKTISNTKIAWIQAELWSKWYIKLHIAEREAVK
jgi:hypothetical protein